MHLDAIGLQRLGRFDRQRGAGRVTPHHDVGQASLGDLGHDPLDHVGHRCERFPPDRQVVAGQLDGVDGHTAVS